MKQTSLFAPDTPKPEPTPTAPIIQAPLPPPFDSSPILLSPVVQEAVFGSTAPPAPAKHQLKGEQHNDTH
ncbi:hypothetical protein ES708_29954 [subsurface metagenome]